MRRHQLQKTMLKISYKGGLRKSNSVQNKPCVTLSLKFFFLKIVFLFVFVYYVLFVYIWVCMHECRCPWLPEKNIRSCGAVVRGGCTAQHRCWNQNLGPLQKQYDLLTAEPSSQVISSSVLHSWCLSKPHQ